MNTPAPIHRIRRLRLEATAFRREEAFGLQQALGFTVHTAAFRKELNAALDGLVPGGQYLKIDRLELRLDLTDSKEFAASFFDSLTRSVRQRMEEGRQDALQPAAAKAFEEEALLGYLWFGNLPGSFPSLRERVLSRARSLAAAGNDALMKRILQAGASDAFVWKRLIGLMGVDGVREMLKQQFGLSSRFFEVLESAAAGGLPYRKERAAQPTPESLRQHKYAFILQLLAEGRSEASITGLLQQPQADGSQWADGWPPALPGLLDPALTGIARQKEAARAQLQQQGYSVLHAGLVLIVPEAVKILKSAGLVEQNNFPDSEAQQRAILLLHFLCTGSTTADEDELLLGKLLCGWPLHEPVDPDCAPGSTVQLEAEQWMEALLAGWKEQHPPALSWLRRHFLNRSGRLCRREGEGWLLEVERKAEDMVFESPLMQKCLPGVVRLPWMTKIVFVRW
ncbi:MAG TPA: contractile injection system tape measure protein [Chitinophagaceae bacterium]|nr:contractile injection system tape measure protein [Chitinophagaceae bacterium]